MADVDDRWYRLVDGQKVRTARYGVGMRWAARWRDEYGKQRSKSFDRKAAADRHVAIVEADTLRGAYVDPSAGRVTFRECAERWRDAQVHRESTRALVETHFRRHVYPVFGDRQIGSIKPSELQAWVRGMEVGRDGREPLMPATVQVVYRFVVAVFRSAVADRIIPASPALNISRTRPVKPRVVPPTSDQIGRLYAAFPSRLRALVTLGAGTGLRQGEAFGLELDCIDFLRRQLTVRQQLVLPAAGAAYLGQPKTALSVRAIPLADAVLAALSEHIRAYPPKALLIEDRTNPAKPVWRPAYLVFVSADGGPLSRTRFSAQTWIPARIAACLPDQFTYHDLRHYFASALIRFGESPKTIQARLGHASATETLDTYGHLWPDSEDRTRQAIEAALTADVRPVFANEAT